MAAEKFLRKGWGFEDESEMRRIACRERRRDFILNRDEGAMELDVEGLS